MNQTEVSIGLGIAVFNGEEFLEQTLQSIRAQEDQISEILIVDDGSTDNSVKILSKWFQGNRKVKIYLSEENRGISFSYNQLLELAQSEYLIIVDQDDLLPEGYIAEAHSKLSQLSTPALIACNWTSNSKLISGIGAILNFLPEWTRIHGKLPVLGWIATRSSIIYPVELARSFKFESSSFDGFDAVHLDGLRLKTHLWWNSKCRFFYRIHPEATSKTRQKIVKPRGFLYSIEYRFRRAVRRFVR